ncbi:MAG: ornithine cyclodeaminase family protein [Gammaproteobacteria bacterium]|nr:ornithine cyclodeaminase family protein [Gammaproteobacteria bacterium]
MTKVAVYGAEDVARWLDWPGCIVAVREAMAGLTAEGREQPLRSISPLEPGKLFALMHGVAPARAGFGAKVLSVFDDQARPGRSRHRGGVLLFERDSGEPLCLADAHEITRIRTACASAVATDALARRDARVLAIFGTGTQAEAHFHALRLVRRFERVVIWGRSAERAAALAERLAAASSGPVVAVADGAAAAAQADVICTTTGSATPVLRHAWLEPGTHVNAVGSSFPGPVEVDDALVVASRYVADSRRSALAAAAEFLKAREAGLVTDAHIAAEIGEVLLGRVPGRQHDRQLTLYKSLGHVVQDLAAAAYVHRRATPSASTDAVRTHDERVDS